MTDKLSVAVGVGIAVAGVLMLGSWQVSVAPASGVALCCALRRYSRGRARRQISYPKVSALPLRRLCP
jgi:hypothetical protein